MCESTALIRKVKLKAFYLLALLYLKKTFTVDWNAKPISLFLCYKN